MSKQKQRDTRHDRIVNPHGDERGRAGEAADPVPGTAVSESYPDGGWGDYEHNPKSAP